MPLLSIISTWKRSFSSCFSEALILHCSWLCHWNLFVWFSWQKGDKPLLFEYIYFLNLTSRGLTIQDGKYLFSWYSLESKLKGTLLGEKKPLWLSLSQGSKTFVHTFKNRATNQCRAWQEESLPWYFVVNALREATGHCRRDSPDMWESLGVFTPWDWVKQV